MALDIDLESAQELTTSELFDFFARQCNAELIDLDPRDPFLRTPGMDIRGGAEPGAIVSRHRQEELEQPLMR